MSSRGSEISLACSRGTCPSVCVRGWMWVGARHFMRLRICQSTCVCVYVCTCVYHGVCVAFLSPFSSSLSCAPFPQFSMSWGHIPSPNRVPGLLETISPSSFPLFFLHCQSKLAVPSRYPLILVETGTPRKEKTLRVTQPVSRRIQMSTQAESMPPAWTTLSKSWLLLSSTDFPHSCLPSGKTLALISLLAPGGPSHQASGHHI